jgi:hypothetical protein
VNGPAYVCERVRAEMRVYVDSSAYSACKNAIVRGQAGLSVRESARECERVREGARECGRVRESARECKRKPNMCENQNMYTAEGERRVQHLRHTHIPVGANLLRFRIPCGAD